MLRASLFAGCLLKKTLQVQIKCGFANELDLAALDSFMSWLKHRLRHGLSEEGGKTRFDCCVPRLCDLFAMT